MGVGKTSHATFETPDLERQIAYYTDVLGLALVTRDNGTAYLASTLDHHSVVLTQGAAAACRRLAFQIAPTDRLADFQKQLADQGAKTERRSAPAPSIREFVSF